MPKVSVVVPIYNVQNYLEKNIDSLVNQTLQDIEIILVNDGSTDDSKKIAEKYKALYPNKIILLDKENGGLSDARNYGIQHATGEFIAFLDSDDYIDKNAYEEMYNRAIAQNADYVECNFVWEFPNNTKVDQCVLYLGKKEMMTYIRVVAWNKLIKASIIKDNNICFPKGLKYEDVEFTYKLIPYLNRTEYIDKPFIHYVQRENSIANKQDERNKEIFTVLDNVIGFYKENHIYSEFEEELEYLYARYSLCSSLKRICQIEDEKTRKELINFTWDNLNCKFPRWKKNKVLISADLLKSIYLRSVNNFTYKIYTFIFRKIYEINKLLNFKQYK